MQLAVAELTAASHYDLDRTYPGDETQLRIPQGRSRSLSSSTRLETLAEIWKVIPLCGQCG